MKVYHSEDEKENATIKLQQWKKGKQTTIPVRSEKMYKTHMGSWKLGNKPLSGQRPTVMSRDITRWRQAVDAE